MSEDTWIWIDDWDRFQHYKHRNPPWIKNYVELLSDEDYLNLSSHRRALLHDLWMAYATSRRRLRADTASLSARFRYRVVSPDIEALADAGFVEVLASTPLAERLQGASAALASRAPARSRETEAEEPPIGGGSSGRSDARARATPAAPAGPNGPEPLDAARSFVARVFDDYPVSEVLRDELMDRQWGPEKVRISGEEADALIAAELENRSW